MNERGVTGRPATVLLVSGKRKCGKDFITDALLDKIGSDVCCVIKISAPIKKHWAEAKGVSFEELMSSGEMKEEHRRGMLEWSQQVRYNDPGHFCSAAISLCGADLKPIWIVSDTRRKTDINWFREGYGEAVLTLRITAPEAVRTCRGWAYTPGIDDAETECDLDDYLLWDKVICNDDTATPQLLVSSIISLLKSHNSVTAELLDHVDNIPLSS